MKVSLDPLVNTEAGQRFMELIEREQLPGDVRSTLAGALTGDLTRQSLLFQAMIDTWPRLQKALSEISGKVRKAPWKICPYKGRDQEASKIAIDKANFIEDVIWETSPNITNNEKSTEGLIDQLVYGYYAGHHVVETLWERKDKYIKPRSYKSVPPRFYGYPTTSKGEDKLMFDPEGGLSGYQYEEFPKHHFLIAMNSSHPGHPTVAAPLRALTGYWLAATFGLKWLLQFSQLYGVPFRWATYDDETTKDKVCKMLENIGSAGYGAFPKGVDLHFEEAKKGAEALPQKMLIEMADKQVEIHILGQSLTSDVGESGSRALGEVHEGVRNDVVERVTDFVADAFNRQLIPSINELNYQDEIDLPKLKANFEKPKDEKGMAERDSILLQNNIPIPKEWFYERHGIPLPEADQEIIGGSLGVEAMRAKLVSAARGDEDKEKLFKDILENMNESLKEGEFLSWESLANLLESEVNS